MVIFLSIFFVVTNAGRIQVVTCFTTADCPKDMCPPRNYPKCESSICKCYKISRFKRLSVTSNRYFS
ncbi:hypothetical protein P8452_25556 [Trifolium repens]|nr:hypothetical protein P8452_25556 [Trifolium repens]